VPVRLGAAANEAQFDKRKRGDEGSVPFDDVMVSSIQVLPDSRSEHLNQARETT